MSTKDKSGKWFPRLRRGSKEESASANDERRASFKQSILAPFSKMETKKSAYFQSTGTQNESMMTQGNKQSDKSAKEPDLPIVRYLDGRFHQTLLATATVVALFCPDLFTVFVDPNYDSVLHIALLVVFGIFFIDLVLSFRFKPSYRWSFYFALDFVAMISMIPDIPFIWELIVPDDTDQDNLSILRAGRIVRTGTRTGRALRLLRFIRFFRIVRILKLVRLFRIHVLRHVISEGNDKYSETPNKLGIRLADLLGKRVILGVMLLLLVLPHLEVHPENMGSLRALEMLEFIKFNSANETFFNMSLSEYQESHDTIVLIAVNGTTYLDKRGTTIRKEALILSVSDTGTSYIMDNDSSNLKDQALLNLLLTTMLILLMGISAFLFNRDVKVHVVNPIIKTTKVIRKLAKTLYILTKDQEKNEDEDDILEGSFIDSIVDQLVTFFSFDDAKDSSKNNAGHGASSSVYPSHAADGSMSVISPGVDEDTTFALKKNHQIKSRKECQEVEGISDSQVLCMQSFEEFWKDKQALQYFRVFLTSEFAVESFLFVEAIDQYKQLWGNVSSFHTDMVKRFVDERAEFQVNISDAERRAILRCDGESFPRTLYDEARMEIFKQLERDNFPRFKNGNLGKELLRTKKLQMMKAARESDSSNSTVGARLDTAQEKPKDVNLIVKRFSNILKEKWEAKSIPTSTNPTNTAATVSSKFRKSFLGGISRKGSLEVEDIE